MTRAEEKDKERKGIIVAVIVHALFILLFFFVTVWKQPNPPTPGMPGIDLNFGFDAAGSGDNNSMDPATENAENTEATENTETTEASAPSDPATATTSSMTSDHVVQETKSTQTTTTKQTATQTSTSQTQQTTSTTTKSGGSTGDGNTDKTGNQGKTTGTLDGKGLYDGTGGGGKGGNGNGSALSMDGWHLDAEPKVDSKQETGKVTFEIKIDDEGNIISIKVLEKQVSEALVKKCEDEIRKMEFVKNKNNGSTAAFSTGKISFVFRLN